MVLLASGSMTCGNAACASSRALAIAFALSTAAAIGVGAAVTDTAFAQTSSRFLAALAFWIPALIIVLGVDRWRARRREKNGNAPPRRRFHAMTRFGAGCSHRRRPMRAPRGASAIAGTIRLTLASAELDPEAHELCILIDRRLPDLIHHELEILPPDDRHRRQKVRELIDLVEQFARHCSRSRLSG